MGPWGFVCFPLGLNYTFFVGFSFFFRFELPPRMPPFFVDGSPLLNFRHPDHPPMQQSKTALATFHATKKNCNAVFCKKCKKTWENNMLHCSFFFYGEKLQVQLWKTASAILSWSGIVVWCYVVCCVWSVGCRPLSVVCCVCPVVAIARRSGTLVGCRGHPYLRQNGFQTHKGS